jgi:hypothetical protein
MITSYLRTVKPCQKTARTANRVGSGYALLSGTLARLAMDVPKESAGYAGVQVRALPGEHHQ